MSTFFQTFMCDAWGITRHLWEFEIHNWIQVRWVLVSFHTWVTQTHCSVLRIFSAQETLPEITTVWCACCSRRLIGKYTCVFSAAPSCSNKATCHWAPSRGHVHCGGEVISLLLISLSYCLTAESWWWQRSRKQEIPPSRNLGVTSHCQKMNTF